MIMENIEKMDDEREVAFLDDLSGRKRFVRLGENLYYIDPEGNRQEVSEAIVRAAIEKHGYVPSENDETKGGIESRS
jgi:hypothetical protein